MLFFFFQTRNKTIEVLHEDFSSWLCNVWKIDLQPGDVCVKSALNFLKFHFFLYI